MEKVLRKMRNCENDAKGDMTTHSVFIPCWRRVPNRNDSTLNLYTTSVLKVGQSVDDRRTVVGSVVLFLVE